MGNHSQCVSKLLQRSGEVFVSKLNISVIPKQENIINIFWRAVLSMYTTEMASAPGTSQSFLLSAHSPKIVPGCHLSWKRSQGYRKSWKYQLVATLSSKDWIVYRGLTQYLPLLDTSSFLFSIVFFYLHQQPLSP